MPFIQPAQHTARSHATSCFAQDTGLWHGSSYRPMASRSIRLSASGAPTSSLYVQIVVFCKETEGLFLVQQDLFVCLCGACQDKPEADRTFSGTGFEAHCGAAASKKWKVSCHWMPVFNLLLSHLEQRPVLFKASHAHCLDSTCTV